MPRLEAWLGHGNSFFREKGGKTQSHGSRVAEAIRRGSGAAESGGAALGSVRHWGRALAAALRSAGEASQRRGAGGLGPAGRALAAARR